MLSYIYYVFFFLCFRESLAYSEEIEEIMRLLHDTCVSQTGVDENLIAKIRVGDFVEDNNLKCYLRCLMVEVSSMDENGIVDEEMVVNAMPEELIEFAEPVIRSCGTVKGVDDCDTAFQTNKCYYFKDPEHYLAV
uniref:Odorant binding protein 15 n=1 Tax=Sirex nitobei TaxID=1602346 RepID=A0A857N371_9HYME|nr:odorant binding protein 15 [Sirex nitobei]